MLLWPSITFRVLAPFVSLIGTVAIIGLPSIREQNFSAQYSIAVLSLFGITLFAIGFAVMLVYFVLAGAVLFALLLCCIVWPITGIWGLFALGVHACGFAVVYDQEGRRLTRFVDVAKMAAKQVALFVEEKQDEVVTGAVDDTAISDTAVIVADAAEAEKVLVDRSGTLVKMSSDG